MALGLLTWSSASTAGPALDRPAFAGRPATFAAGAQLGAAVWIDTDKGRVHVAFASNGGQTAFSGKVCSRSSIEDLKPQDLEPSDSIKLDPKKRCVGFKLDTKGGLDGFSFALPIDAVIFDLAQNQRPLTPPSIWVGAAGLHPDSSPFALPKVKQAAPVAG
jgi:hypothetical protein